MEQVRPQPCSHVDRQGRQGESLARVVGPHVGGYVEHSADAESDLSLLFRWECLTECDICERLRLGRPTGSEQRHRGTGHQRAAKRMSRRGRGQRPLREVSGGGAGGGTGRPLPPPPRGRRRLPPPRPPPRPLRAPPLPTRPPPPRAP